MKCAVYAALFLLSYLVYLLPSSDDYPVILGCATGVLIGGLSKRSL